jgi:putative heme iron utilization protein
MGDPDVTDAFGPEVVAQIAGHMNGDHADDNVLIVRALGGVPEATSARMTGLDQDAMIFAARSGDGPEVEARVPFSERLTERRQVRAEAVRMYREACGKLGVPARH